MKQNDLVKVVDHKSQKVIEVGGPALGSRELVGLILPVLKTSNWAIGRWALLKANNVNAWFHESLLETVYESD